MAYAYVNASGASLKIGGNLVDTNQVINTTIDIEISDTKEIQHYGTYPVADVVGKRLKASGSFRYYKNPSGGSPVVPTGALTGLVVNTVSGIYFSGQVLITKSSMDLTVENDENEVSVDWTAAGAYTIESGHASI